MRSRYRQHETPEALTNDLDNLVFKQMNSSTQKPSANISKATAACGRKPPEQNLAINAIWEGSIYPMENVTILSPGEAKNEELHQAEQVQRSALTRASLERS